MEKIRENLLLIFIPVLILVGLFTFYYLGSLAVDDTDTVTLSTNVQTAIAISLSSGSYAFGNLTAGTPLKGSVGIDVDVTTNASNGYTLGIHDGVAGSNSALLHTDTTTRIADTSFTIASPDLWVSGTTKGLGATVFSADTSKEAKWGTGTTYNDANNKYAAVPQAATTIHTSTGYKTGSDTTSVAFVVDVEADQKSGSYSGDVTFTATAVLI